MLLENDRVGFVIPQRREQEDEHGNARKVCAKNPASPADRYQKKKGTGPSEPATLLPRNQRKSMCPPICSQLPCMNIEVKSPSYHERWSGGTSCGSHGPASVHG